MMQAASSPLGLGRHGDDKEIAYSCNVDVAVGRTGGELKTERICFLVFMADFLGRSMTRIPNLAGQQVKRKLTDENTLDKWSQN